MTQAEALNILKTGRSTFITGAAGSGKTYLLNQYLSYLTERGADVGITASTGIAATHLGGVTIHAWSGLGIRDRLTERDLEDLEQREHVWRRIARTQVLVIDEVSMLHHFRLDLFDRILRHLRRSSVPFGGVQLILCGDFFQLPPVTRGDAPPTRLAYHASSWQELQPTVCYLEEQHRQVDADYLGVLSDLRSGAVSALSRERLVSRYGVAPEGPVAPTKLYCHNANVDAENERELAKLPGNPVSYRRSSRGSAALVEGLQKGCLAPETLYLKPGARVMFVKNSFEEGYANGTLGVVERCDAKGVRVRTARGSRIEVEPTSWRVEDDGRVKAEITQYPLRLAWAITVHKSQGMSLDAAEVDLSRSFEDGMGYVALSRVRSLAGLHLLGLNEAALQVSAEVLAKDQEFRQASAQHAAEFRHLSSREVQTAQKAFIDRIAPNGPKPPKVKKEKVDTVHETEKLFLAGEALPEIAAARGLKASTILGHLEKLKRKNPALDFTRLAADMPAPRLKKIQSVLAASRDADGRYSVGQAKAALGRDVSYEELYVARLLM